MASDEGFKDKNFTSRADPGCLTRVASQFCALGERDPKRSFSLRGGHFSAGVASGECECGQGLHRVDHVQCMCSKFNAPTYTVHVPARGPGGIMPTTQSSTLEEEGSVAERP